MEGGSHVRPPIGQKSEISSPGSTTKPVIRQHPAFRIETFAGMHPDILTFSSRDGGLRVLVSHELLSGERWLHVSLSRRSRMPTYEDMVLCRQAFIGDDVPAYQVFPITSEHRSLHEFCLHLWAPLDRDPFPDLLGHRADSVAPKESK